MQALFVAIAIVAGLIIGFIIRSSSARREAALLEQRNRESLDALKPSSDNSRSPNPSPRRAPASNPSPQNAPLPSRSSMMRSRIFEPISTTRPPAKPLFARASASSKPN